MPKVSVIIPAYNCEKFISTAVESVLKQTYKDYEIIIVNDGSTDGTAEVISQFSTAVKYIYQTNGGPAGARNTGILNAQGEYIAFLDQDDAWSSDKLQMQVDILAKDKKIGLVCTDAYILNDASFTNSISKSLRIFQLRPPHRGKVLRDLFSVNFIATSSVMVRKKCFEKIGLFNPSLTPIEDYDRWLHIAALYEVDYIDRPLVKYRDHIACFRKNRILTVTNIINTLNVILAEYPILKAVLGKKVNKKFSQLYVTLGKMYLSKGDFKKAFYNFSLSFKLKKSPFLPFYVLFSYCFDCLKQILRDIRSKIAIYLF